METDEQFRNRIARVATVPRALWNAFAGAQLDRYALGVGLKRVTWVPSEKLEATPDGRVIQHGAFCPCAGAREVPTHRVTVCSGGSISLLEVHWWHPKPRCPNDEARTVAEGRLALFTEGFRNIHTGDFMHAELMLNAASDQAWPECFDLIRTEQIVTCSGREPVLKDPPYAREPPQPDLTTAVASFEDLAKAIKAKCPVCGSYKHGLLRSSRKIAPLAHDMLAAQVKTGGHDGEEAIMRCFHRLREHWEIVKRLDRDLVLVGDMGPCFALTERDEAAY